jgi:hypothetical protein
MPARSVVAIALNGCIRGLWAIAARERRQSTRVRDVVVDKDALSPWWVTSAMSGWRVEELDERHGMTALGAEAPRRRCVVVTTALVIIAGALGWRCMEQRSCFSEIGLALTVGEQPKVPDTVKARYAARGITGFMQSPCLCGVRRPRADPDS